MSGGMTEASVALRCARWPHPAPDSDRDRRPAVSSGRLPRHRLPGWSGDRLTLRSTTGWHGADPGEWHRRLHEHVNGDDVAFYSPFSYLGLLTISGNPLGDPPFNTQLADARFIEPSVFLRGPMEKPRAGVARPHPFQELRPSVTRSEVLGFVDVDQRFCRNRTTAVTATHGRMAGR